jgi:hypothetical protein
MLLAEKWEEERKRGFESSTLLAEKLCIRNLGGNCFQSANTMSTTLTGYNRRAAKTDNNTKKYTEPGADPGGA